MDIQAESGHAPPTPRVHTPKVPGEDPRFRAIVEHALVGVAELALDGTLTLVNAALCAITAYPEAELLSRRFQDITHPDDRAHCDAQFRQAVATGESFVMDTRYVRPDGTAVCVSASVAVIGDATGQPERVVMVVTDITERKQAEVALLRRDRLARLHADVSEALIALTSLPEMLRACTDALVVHLDAAFARIWTLDPTGSMLHLRASSGLYTHLDGAHAHIPVGALKIGWIAATRTPHLTNQVIGDARVEQQDWAQREHMVAFAGYPLLVSDRLVGVVALFAQHPLTGVTLTALESAANSLALGIERKQAEEALRESERLLRDSEQWLSTALRAARMGTFDWNPSTDRVTLTAASADVFGLVPGTTLPTAADAFQIVHPDDRARHRATFLDAARRGGDYRSEYRVIRPRDGQVAWIEERGSVVVDPDTGHVRTRGVHWDVSDRKRADEAARVANERFAVVAQATNDAIWDWDLRTDGLWWNDGVRTLFGYPPGDVPNAVDWWYTHIHPDDRARVVGSIHQVINGGAHTWASEYRFLKVDGTFAEVSDRGFVLHDDGGTPVRMLGGMTDITARKQAEADLARALAAAQAALQTRDQFLSIASHELRTPLTSLVGYATLLPQAVARGRGQVDKMADRIVRQAERLNGLIDQLLDISRLQRGQFAIDRRPLDVAALVGQVVDEVRATLPPTTQHRVDLTTPDTPVRIDGDAERLEQVLHNLLSNALKYSPQGGTVRVQVAHTATDAVVAVTDEGIGIPSNAQAHLFEPFYRAPNVGGQASGFGLGLHIVREIVERHGGCIEVESTEGVGSTFQVVLPIQETHAAQARGTS